MSRKQGSSECLNQSAVVAPAEQQNEFYSKHSFDRFVRLKSVI
jgi:hypothetical protein